jgi:hypothetical protein
MLKDLKFYQNRYRKLINDLKDELAADIKEEEIKQTETSKRLLLNIKRSLDLLSIDIRDNFKH